MQSVLHRKLLFGGEEANLLDNALLANHRGGIPLRETAFLDHFQSPKLARYVGDSSAQLSVLHRGNAAHHPPAVYHTGF